MLVSSFCCGQLQSERKRNVILLMWRGTAFSACFDCDRMQTAWGRGSSPLPAHHRTGYLKEGTEVHQAAQDSRSALPFTEDERKGMGRLTLLMDVWVHRVVCELFHAGRVS